MDIPPPSKKTISEELAEAFLFGSIKWIAVGQLRMTFKEQGCPSTFNGF